MPNKKSFFSLSSILGAVVFGVLVLGVVAVNMGSRSSEQAYVVGSTEVANTVAAEQPVYGEQNQVEGQVAGVQIAQIKEDDGESSPSLQCSSSCTARCDANQLSCWLDSCSGCEPQGTMAFFCEGRLTGTQSCNEFNDINSLFLNQGNLGDAGSNPARWCKTVQIDAYAQKPDGSTNSALVVYIGDRGQTCVQGTGCNPSNLDWDCRNLTTPTPTPTTQCPGKPATTCVNNADGTASIRVSWSLNGAPSTTRYIVRADHMFGITNQCRNANQTLVGWYCPAGVSICDPLNLGYRCDDRMVYQTGSTTTLNNIERGKLYKVYTQVDPTGCSSQSTDVTCPVLPTPPVTPPVTPPPSSTPALLTCNSVCNYGPGVRDLCTAANPTWICYPGAQYPGQTSGQGNCRLATNPEGNPESLLCKDRIVASPTPPMGPMCLGIARVVTQSIPNDPDPNTPDVGEMVKFRCEPVTGWSNVSYEFRWMKPNGLVESIRKSATVANESESRLVDQVGQYHAQCRVCVAGAQTCQEFEPFPTVRGAFTETSDFAPSDPAEFDSINDSIQQ